MYVSVNVHVSEDRLVENGDSLRPREQEFGSVWDWLLITAVVIGSSGCNNIGGYKNHSCSELLIESLISTALKAADEETLCCVLRLPSAPHKASFSLSEVGVTAMTIRNKSE